MPFSIHLRLLRVQPPAWTSSSTQTVGDFIRGVAGKMRTDYSALAAGFERAATGADVILGTAMTITFALNLGEKLGTPVWVAKLNGDIPSCAWVNPGATRSPIGWLNLMKCYGYWLDVTAATHAVGIGKEEERERARLGLPPSIPTLQRIEEMGHTPSLLGFSPTLFPKPIDYPVWAFQCGYWRSGTSGEDNGAYPTLRRTNSGGGNGGGGVPVQLSDPVFRSFLTISPFRRPLGMKMTPAGTAAVAARAAADVLDGQLRGPIAVITFGSMMGVADTLIADITGVVRDRGWKVLILTGWKGAERPAGVPGDDPCIYCTESMPHDWLFRQVRRRT